MARGSFLGRIGRAIRNIVAPPPPPPPRPPREPEPPEPPREVTRREYRDIWRDERPKRQFKFDRHLAIFERMAQSVNEDDPDELQRLWRSYIENIVKGKGRYRRQDSQNMFWRDIGIDPQDFNWASWRQAMGFTGKRRSRTA